MNGSPFKETPTGQFSLRTLFLVVTAIAVFLGWLRASPGSMIFCLSAAVPIAVVWITRVQRPPSTGARIAWRFYFPIVLFLNVALTFVLTAAGIISALKLAAVHDTYRGLGFYVGQAFIGLVSGIVVAASIAVIKLAK